MPYLGTFGLEYEKAIVISEISTLKFLRNESFPHIVNLGRGSGFSRRRGLGPGLGSLYKVCHGKSQIQF